MLRLTRKACESVAQIAHAAYPEECCGLLVGRAEEGLVMAVEQTPNIDRERPLDRYELDPQDFLRVDRGSRASANQILGVFHSHPDHQPVPSPVDAAQAWSDLSYLIVAVDSTGRVEMRCWRWSDEAKQFQEESVQVVDDTEPCP